MSQKTIVSSIENREHFKRLLENNPGLVIIKFGATWCGPCKKIKSVVDGFFCSSPDSVLCCDIDIDECPDVYSYLKTKKMVNGIPVMLCWKKGNTTFIPDESITGSSPNDLDNFFKRCGVQLRNVPT